MRHFEAERRKMRKQNLIGVLTAILLGLFSTACGVLNSEPLPNMRTADEANKFVVEAEQSYKNADGQMKAIFAEPVGKDKLASIKEKKPKFEQAAADFKIAKDKFAQASAKFKEALNGGKGWESGLHLRFEKLSEAYQKWSELAEVEAQLAEETINIKDINSFLSKTKELETKAQKLNEEADAKIKSSREPPFKIK